MRITVLSKDMFSKYVSDGLIEKNENKKVFYLSINNPNDLDKTPFREDSADFKSMWFYDIEDDLKCSESGKEYHPITNEQVNELFNYLMSHKDYDYFIVHCSAGISRSGAVGTFMNDLFGESHQEFRRRNKYILPNLYIYNKLKEKL